MKSDTEIKKDKTEFRESHPDELAPESRKERQKKEWMEWMKSDTAEQKKQENLAREHDLVVIPIAWRGRHDMLEITKAAEDIKACVAQQGVDAWIDSRRQYSPGQKFAHWEHKGVMLRVEVGPDDLKAGVCRVCRAKTPGDYKTVERKRVKLPPGGARALLLALKEMGLSQIEIDRREGDSADEEEAADAAAAVAANPKKAAPAKIKAEKAAPGGGAAGADELDGNWAPRTASVAAQAKKEGKKMKKQKT